MRFDVQGMHCGHCVRAITRAVQALDPAARVDIDLAAGTVDVESGTATPSQIVEAIASEGYAATARP
ncbi:MAG: heavy-metal-associated domain-containing protein [Pseudomonadota bacterium]